jgi:glycogen debranching enzyme
VTNILVLRAIRINVTEDGFDTLLAHMVDGGCVGSISEIFDAEPPFTPRGCFAQAWSVAEVARLVVKLAACEMLVRRTAGSQASEAV